MKNNIEIITERIIRNEKIISAIIYGTSNYNINSVDVDILIIIPSDYGVVPSEDYLELRQFKNELSRITNSDIDLVPHTTDELDDYMSPLYYPRYNPALFFGSSIKGEIKIQQPQIKNIDFYELAKYVLLDNRTITRRQLLRSSKIDEINIYLSKLGHLFGNTLTYLALRDRLSYYENPSNLFRCAEIIEERFSIGAINYQKFIEITRANIEKYNQIELINSMLKIMKWYETFVSNLLYKPIENMGNKLDNILNN